MKAHRIKVGVWVLSVGLVLAPSADARASAAASSPTRVTEQPPDDSATAPSVPEAGADREVSEATLNEARRRFDQGISLYEDGDYSLALIEFERAYELVPNYRVLYNIGQVSIQLRQYARARQALEQYLSTGANSIDPQREAEVQADIQMLKSRTAYVSIEVQQPGVTLWIDETPRGTTPLSGPLLVDAGQHRIELRKPGYRAEQRFVTLAGGEEQTLRFELQVIDRSPKTVEKQTIVVRDTGVDARSTWVWLGVGATGVLAAGAVATGVLGLSEASTLEELRNTPGASRQELDDAQSRARRMFIATDVLGLAALAMGGVTLYAVFSAGDEEAKAVTDVKVSYSGSGVTLSGSF